MNQSRPDPESADPVWKLLERRGQIPVKRDFHERTLMAVREVPQDRPLPSMRVFSLRWIAGAAGVAAVLAFCFASFNSARLQQDQTTAVAEVLSPAELPDEFFFADVEIADPHLDALQGVADYEALTQISDVEELDSHAMLALVTGE